MSTPDDRRAAARDAMNATRDAHLREHSTLGLPVRIDRPPVNREPGPYEPGQANILDRPLTDRFRALKE